MLDAATIGARNPVCLIIERNIAPRWYDAHIGAATLRRQLALPFPSREPPDMSRLLARLLFLAVFLCGRNLLAQNTVTLEGSVKSGGTPIGNAQVNVENTATSESKNTVTRPNGEFRVIGLLTGEYSVTVRSLGFRPLTQTVQIV